MKKTPVKILVSLLSLALLLSGCSTAAKTGTTTEAKKPVLELKLSHFDPPTAADAIQVDEWAKRVEAKAKGELKITVYPAATLGAAKDQFDLARTGVADISNSYEGLTPGLFPASEVMLLPMLGFETAEQASQVFMDLYMNTDYLKKDYSQVKVMYLHTHAPAFIATKGKKIETLEDIKGLKLRVAGGPITSLTTKLGAFPVGLATPDIYTSLEKGVISGFLLEATGTQAYKLNEQITNVLDSNMYVGPFCVVMNQAKWDSLPDNIKAAFDSENGIAGAANAGKVWDGVTNKYEKEVLASKINTLSPTEKARWDEVSKTVAQEWIKGMDAKGYPGQKIYDKVIELMAKYKK